jgi:hypothetical protein
VSEILSAWVRGGGEPRLPVSTGGKVGLAVQLLLPKDGSLDKTVSELLRKLHSEKIVLRTVTCLAPAEAVSAKGVPQPLPEDLSPRLVKMGLVRPEARKGSPPCTPEEVAWRDLILGYNASIRYHGGTRVPIDRRLEPRSAAPQRKVAERASSEIAKLREELAKKEEQNAAVLSALAAAMTRIGNAVVDLKKADEEQSVVEPAVVAQGLAQALEDTDTAVAAAYVQSDKGSSTTEIVPYEDHEDLMRDGFGSEPDVAANSHITLNEGRWELFDPKNIEEGGAYILVRSVHNGELYVAPKKATIPQASDLRTTGFLRFAKASAKGKKQKASPPPSDAGDAPEEVSSPATLAEKQRAAPGTVSKVASDERLTSYLCPGCKAVHGTSHDSGCKHSSTPWGKMSAAARKEREQALTAPKPKPKPAARGKPVKKAEEPKKEKPSTPAVERVDPLKATLVPLTDKEESKLRKHFGLKPPCEPETLKSLPPKERDAKLKESTIPRWAVAATLAERKNLSAILDGTLTLELFKAGKFLRASKKSSQKYITDRWQALKAKYENTSLLEKPRTPKEKNFRKEFDLLRKEVGEHPSLPKPRKAGAPERAGGRTSPRQSQGAAPPPGSISFDTLKALADLLRALK